jgi:hypothetical protein
LDKTFSGRVRNNYKVIEAKMFLDFQKKIKEARVVSPHGRGH